MASDQLSSKEYNQELLKEFVLAHHNRYTIKEYLGSGQYGETFRALDLYRNIDVCIKLFKTGTAHKGSKRDWHITSTIKHPFVADTFTVEFFPSHSINKECLAVISRYIEGRNLDYVLNRLEGSTELIEFQKNKLLYEAIGNLCEAIHVCHDAGFGHGDLHERNVIICKNQEPTRTTLYAVLIDFDNGTFGGLGMSEDKRKESDLRAICRLVGCISFGSIWHEALQSLLLPCATALQIRETLCCTLKFLGGIGNYRVSHFTSERFEDGLKTMLFSQTSIGFEVLHFFDSIATELEVIPEYEKGLKKVQEGIKNNAWEYLGMSFKSQIVYGDENGAVAELLGSSG